MLRLSILATAGLLTLMAVASAAPTLKRVRGTVDSAGNGTVTIKTSDGTTASVTLAADTKFASVVKASLEDVKDGAFIGTATKDEAKPTALEVVVFPEAMRGTGEGHYDWDTIVDTTATGGKAVKSSMTNGTIKSSAKPMAKSAMTNGTIKSGTVAGGGKVLTVTYSGGKSIDITVPSTAPIVSVAPADVSIVQPGAKIFVIAAVDGDKLDAKLVSVGKDGLTPPM